MKVVIATHNPGKLRELQALLAPCGCEAVMSRMETPPEETGGSFEENALIKARAECLFAGLPAIADDSGLCVRALGGAPGVRSARFAPPGERRKTLLRMMEGVTDRHACFVCCAALVLPGGREITARGECEGAIAHASAGEGGFGYDSIFFLPDLGVTMAQITEREKNARSHRGRALRALLAQWPE
ncbi:MAG: RdgB/HAM1 family non-canonical purine NTP pyrophosphatase [Oscillospiraceae bacterium]|nr:RdgB/HAM1 family non-canonical purine NTP pyrophosphatase [Oscillospiraceae bacterium]